MQQTACGTLYAAGWLMVHGADRADSGDGCATRKSAGTGVFLAAAASVGELGGLFFLYTRVFKGSVDRD